MICTIQTLLTTGLICLVLAVTGSAESFGGSNGRCSGSTWNFRNCYWGPDDYCQKPQPCVPCTAAKCYTCDCYDGKPLPCVKCPGGCVRPDDYVRKCPPCPPCQCRTPKLPCRIFR